MSLKTDTCSKCDQPLDGAHTSYCKSCLAAYYRERRKDPRIARANYEATQRWKERNPEQWNRIRRNSILQREYGITLNDYEAMLAAQDFMCAICGEELLPWPHLDHNHETGQVRDILCGPCNLGLGHVREDPDIATAMAAYLRRHSQEG